MARFVAVRDRRLWCSSRNASTRHLSCGQEQLVRFDPNGYSINRVTRAPVEFADVLMGSV